MGWPLGASSPQHVGGRGGDSPTGCGVSAGGARGGGSGQARPPRRWPCRSRWRTPSRLALIPRAAGDSVSPRGGDGRGPVGLRGSQRLLRFSSLRPHELLGSRRRRRRQVPAVGGVAIVTAYRLEACQDLTLSLRPDVLRPSILGTVEAGTRLSHRDGRLHASQLCAAVESRSVLPARSISLVKAKVQSDAVKTPQGLRGPGQVEVTRPVTCSKVSAEASQRR